MRRIEAVAGIIWREGAFLAVERPEGKIMAGYWEFPGGKVEAGEEPVQALRRELHEELGITDVEAAFWHTVEHAYEHGIITLHLFHVMSHAGEPEGLEGQNLRWVAPVDAMRMRFLPADIPIVRAFASRAQPCEGGSCCL